MARVSDVPTYKLQTFKSVANILGIARAEGLAKVPIKRGRFVLSEPVGDGFEAFETGYMGVDIEEWDDQNILVNGPDGIEDDEYVADSYDFQRYCYLEGLKTRTGEKYEKLAQYGALMNQLLHAFPDAKVYTDFGAAFEVCRIYYSGEQTATVPDSQRYMWDNANALARHITAAGLGACQLGGEAVKKAVANIKSFNNLNKECADAKCAAEAWERARTSLMTSGVRLAHKQMDSDELKYTRFQVKNSYVANNLGFKYVFKISMFTIFITADRKKMFIFDYAHLDQVRELMRSWYGMELYVTGYRASVGDPENSNRFTSAYRKCFEWMVDSMSMGENQTKLAKFMKTCLAILQNDFHDHSEKLDMGSSGRSWNLLIEASALYPKQHMWHHCLDQSGATDREKNNLAYMFHLLPCPDADPGKVFNRTVNQMNNANKADPEKFRMFMNYVKATDAAKFTVASKGGITLRTQDGYTYKDKQWWKTCKSGTLFYPPEHEWGMCWIEDEIPVPRAIDTWYTTAGDVTRIPSDISFYDTQAKKTKVDRFECNELLYVLMHAPDVVPGLHPSVLMTKLENDDYTWDKIADMSIKSENTKEGPKMRETWSGDAITREIMSEFDHAAIPIAAHYRGVTSRKTDSQVLRIFDKMCEYTIGDTFNAIVSTDISGWSPSADREAWCEHHQYVFNMTTMCNKINMAKTLSGIRACIAKRGVLKTAVLKDGLFQGWTGTLDTLLNNKVCLLSTRIGKNEGYLPMDAQADTASLIDDAVQGIRFPKHFTREQAQRAASKHLDTTTKVWSWVSAEVSAVKTIYSTIKFIFLNRFHCEGSEVLTDMKTFAKVDRDLTRRLSTINQQCDTVIGAYRSSVAKGSDPLTCYALAISRCCELVSQTNKHFFTLSPSQAIAAAFAPRTLCGLGFPHFVAFTTKERVDHLTMFLGICARLRSLMDNDHAKREFDIPVASFIGQPLSKPGPLGTLADPWSVKSKNYASHEAVVYRKLKERMKKRCDSRVIREAFDLADHPICSQAVDALLKSYSVDAHILSAISETLPESVISAMIDKAHKADLILSLFPFSVRSELIIGMVQGNRDQIRNTVNIAKNRLAFSDPVTVQNYIHYAYLLRERYFSASGYSILNNSTPDPATMLARQRVPTGSSMIVTTDKIFSRCCDSHDYEKEMYRNVFDGTPELPGRRGFITSGIFDFMPEAARGMSPVQKCILKASQVVSHIATTVDPSKAELLAIDTWRMFCVSWGSSSAVEFKLPLFYINKDISWKRIDASSFNKTHPIICYPNSHNAVRVNAVAAGKMFDIVKSPVNLASVITAAKTVALVERAPYPDGIDDLIYSMLEEAFIPFGLKLAYDVAEERSRDKLITFFQTTERVSHGLLGSAFDAAMTNYIDLTPAPEDYGGSSKVAALVFPARSMLEKGYQEKAIAEQLEQYFNKNDIERICLMPSYKISKKQKISRIVSNADEATIAQNMSAQTKFRIYSAYGNKSQAAIQLVVELILDSTPGVLPDDMYSASWGQIDRVVTRCIPDWRDKLRNALVAAKRVEGWEGCSWDVMNRSLGIAPGEFVRLFDIGKTSISDKCISLFSTLLYFGLGKYRVPEMYVSNAKDYPGQMEKQWRFAARSESIRAQKPNNTKSQILTCKISASIYRAAIKYYKRSDIFQFCNNVIISGLSSVLDITAFNMDDSDGIPTIESARLAVSAFNDTQKKTKYDTERIMGILASVCSDHAMFQARQVTNSEMLKHIVEMRTDKDMPNPDDIELSIPEFSGTITIGDPGTSPKKQSEAAQIGIDAVNRKKYELILCYREMDIAKMRDIEKGVIPLDEPDREIDEEVLEAIIEEWDDVASCLNEASALEGDMLQADEE